MNTHTTAVISGATGFLGSHLALEMLRADPAVKLLCLARGAEGREPQARIVRALEVAARTSGVLLTRAMLDRVQVLAANPLEPVPVGTAAAGAPAAGPRAFWHCAASVRFTESVPGELARTNVEGTLNALAWARQLGCTAFQHVSTAYVAGARAGDIEEALADTAPAYINAYEASKFEGERRVREVCEATGMAWRVFRPSIVVGHSRTHLSGSDSGMYRYVRMITEFWFGALQRGRGQAAPLRVCLPAGASSNIVPVDVCVLEMLAVAANPASVRGVFHLVGRDDVLCRHLFDAINALTPVRIEIVSDPAALSDSDLALAQGLAHYAPYLVAEKRFARTATLSGAGTDLQQGLTYGGALVHGLVGRAVARHAADGGPTRSSGLFARQHRLEEGFNLVGEVLARAEAGNPTAVALSDEARDVSYGALPHEVRRAAAALSRVGAFAGQRVGLIAADSVTSALVMLGAIYTGTVVVRLNPLLPLRQIRELLAAHAVPLVLADDAIAATLQVPADGARVLRIGALLDDGAAGDGALPTLCSAHDPALGVFTSGSTGQPQLVLHSHLAPLVAAERYGAQVLDIKPSDVLFSASRLSFAFGLQNLFLALLHGARAVLAPARIDAASFVRVARHFRPTVVFAVPTVYQMVLDAGITRIELDLAQVRAMVSAGEPLPSTVAARWRNAFGVRLLDSLGSSEVFSTYLSNLVDCDGKGATGKLMPGFDALLCDERGSAVADGTPGVMWIRGPSVIARYPIGSARSEHLFRDEWFCTKDVFSRDEDGYFHYHGRQGDMFKVAGQWVSPVEVEAVLLEHPRVREAAVVASNSGDGTVRPEAFVVVDEGPVDGLAEALRTMCQQALGRSKQPHRIEFVRELPRTLNGKLRRIDLRPAATPAGMSSLMEN